ncbi:MAG: transcription termination/antitermination protein NusA, partial [candidate division Zixibacteria bacterium]|nr:transcription termination/antitermination protein NusA [candidate division Zixibacteria bacterium]
MGYDLVEAMTVLAREKHIDFDVVVDTIGASMLAAARKKFPDAENISYSFNKKEGEIVIIAVKAVVEGEADPVTEISLAEAKELDKSARVGDEMEIYLDHEGFGRNAIASAKQVLMQKVREAE